MRRPLVTAVLAALLAPALFVALPVSEAATDDGPEVARVAALPTPRMGTSAVWTGEAAYVFGGRDASGHLADILRYDEADRTVTKLAAKLPTGRSITAATWDGRYAYVIGGETASGVTADIIRFDPATETVTKMTSLGRAAYRLTALYDGARVHVIGGDHNGWLDFHTFTVFSPTRNAIDLSSASTWSEVDAAASAWRGEWGWVVGGCRNEACPTRQVEAYHIRPDGVQESVVRSSLSQARDRAAAALVGDRVVLAGGRTSTAPVDSLAKLIIPADGWSAPSGTTLDVRLPSARWYASAVWTGESILVFGGEGSCGGPFCDDVLDVRPRPAAPVVVATPVLAGKVDVSWLAPSGDSYVALSGYRVYRQTLDGATTLIAETPPSVTSWRDDPPGPAVYAYAVAAVETVGGREGDLSTWTPGLAVS